MGNETTTSGDILIHRIRHQIFGSGLSKSDILQILAWPLLCIIFTTGLWSWTISKINAEKRVCEKKVLQEASALCKDYTHYLAQAVEQANQITLQLQYEWHHSHSSSHLQELSLRGVFRNPRIVNVVVINREGVPVASILGNPEKISYKDFDYFVYHKNDDSQGLLIGKPSLSPLSGKNAITFSRRLSTPQGAFDGVAMVSFDSHFLTAYYAGSFPGRTGLLMLAGLDGTLRSVTIGNATQDPVPAVLRAVPLFNSPEGAAYLSGEPWFQDKLSRYVAWKTLEDYPMVATVGLSEKEYLAPYKKTSATDKAVAVWGSIILLLFAAVATGMTTRLVRKKHQEEEVRKAYRLATEGGSEGYYMYEALHNKSGAVVDFALVDCNERGAEFFGISQIQLLQMKLSSLYPAPYWEELMDIFRGAMVAGFWEDETRTPPDSPLRIEWSKRRIVRSGNGLAVTVQDISERKQSEANLRLMNERFVLATNAGQVGVWDWDIGMNKLVWDDSMYRLYGIRKEDFGGAYDAWARTIHPLDRARTESEIQAALRGEREYACEFRILRPDDTVRYLKADSMTIRDEAGKPLRMIGTNIDLTERRTAEQERRSLELQMQQAQKLESLGVLAGGIAHDFNNILMAIIGNAELASMHINKESPAYENLQRIEQASGRAADLAKQMLAYSGRGRFVIENIDLNILLQEMLHMLEVSISKKAVLQFNPHRHLPAIEADATQIRQVIMNLVINASEAIGENNGTITITTGCLDCDQNYLRSSLMQDAQKEGLYVYFEVLDTGCGMDNETLAKIFDPFFTTKFTGRGLGMAAVLGIVRGHKGVIKVCSEVGKGTSFKILLPASSRQVDTLNSRTQDDNWKGEGIVLLVDDEETVRGIGTEMLEKLGFTVITAEDGWDALEKFKICANIAFVILDLTMPRMDGEQCLRELRKLKPSLKIIVSSGFSDYEIAQKFAGERLAGFIQKPYKLSTLRAVVQNV